MVSGLTLGFVDGLTFNWSLAIADKRGVARLDLLFGGNLLVFDEAVLDKVLLALFLLLWLKVGSVGGVALLAVAMLAGDDIIVLSLLNHDNLVNAPLARCGNGSNVQWNLLTSCTLTGSTVREPQAILSPGILMMVVLIMMVVMVSSGLTEWEDTSKVLSVPSL